MKKSQSIINAENLGITLKNVKTFEGHDTMQGFNADVYINGKLAFHAFDAAYGGCYEYSPAKKGQRNCEIHEVIQGLEEKLKVSPKYKTMLGSKEYEFQDNLDMVISALVSDFEIQKGIKKDSKKGILICRGDLGYEIIKWKLTIPNMIKKYGIDRMLPSIQKAVMECQAKKEEILNVEYLKSIGVKF